MRRVQATLDLDQHQSDFLEITADYFDMPEQDFLNACLQSGIAHAQDKYHEYLETVGNGDGKEYPEPSADEI